MISSRHVNRILKHSDRSFGLEKLNDSLIISPLSKEEDPRVKKLKKELEKLDLTPKQQKPKYINFKI